MELLVVETVVVVEVVVVVVFVLVVLVVLELVVVVVLVLVNNVGMALPTGLGYFTETSTIMSTSGDGPWHSRGGLFPGATAQSPVG